jgi:hypothetical protein
VLAGTASLTREGAGTCVGHPMRGSHHDPLRVKILRITDGPIASMETAVECAPGEIGEIVVNGPPVTQSYDGLPVSNTLAKIPETSENSEARPPLASHGRLRLSGWKRSPLVLWPAG